MKLVGAIPFFVLSALALTLLVGVIRDLRRGAFTRSRITRLGSPTLFWSIGIITSLVCLYFFYATGRIALTLVTE